MGEKWLRVGEKVWARDLKGRSMAERMLVKIGVWLAIIASPTAIAAQQVVMQILLDQKVTVSDGTKLSVNVFKPAGSQRLPTIFSFSPYNLEQAYQQGPWFATHGYNYVRGDLRGRGNSEGQFN